VESDASKEMHFVDFVVSDKNGKQRGVVSPVRFYYRSHQDQAINEVGVLHGVTDDFYVVLGNLSNASGKASIQVFINSLVSWIWIGMVVLTLGTAFSLWDFRRSGVLRHQPSSPATGKETHAP
jgi:cytochrome c biogenesis factor